MTAIYEFSAFLRFPAEDKEEAWRRAQMLSDAVSHGEVSLVLDDSEPLVEEDDQEAERPADDQKPSADGDRIPTDGQALDEIQVELDGVEWRPERVETVASIVRSTGRPVRDLP